MTFATVDYFVPDELDCLAWSSHHRQLALCTPTHIHLMSRDGNDGSVRRGYIRYEDVFAETPPSKSSNEGPWKLTRCGFRQACWWPQPSSFLDVLVMINYAGQIAFLECGAVELYRGANWRPLMMPPNFLAGSLGVNVLAVKGTGQLCLARNDGSIQMVTPEWQSEQLISLPLDPNEAVSFLYSIDRASLLMVGTCSGRVFYSHGSKCHLLIDDGILQTGPVMPLTMSSDTFIIAKFNRLYFATVQIRGSSVSVLITDQMEIKGLFLPISALLPARTNSQLVLAISTNGQIFEIDVQAKTFRRTLEIPWHASDDCDPVNGDGDENGGVDDGDDDGGLSEVDPEGPAEITADARDQLFHQCLLIYNQSFAWICETIRITASASLKSRIYLYRLDPESSVSTLLKLTSSNSTSSCSKLNPSESVITAFDRKPHKCPECNLAVSRIEDKTPSLLCACPHGHIFDICASSGDPIPRLADIRQCLGCGSRFSLASVSLCCPYCSGHVLPVFCL